MDYDKMSSQPLGLCVHMLPHPSSEQPDVADQNPELKVLGGLPFPDWTW